MNLIEHRRRFEEILQPIMDMGRIQEMSQYTQHGRTSTLEHATNVAWRSFVISHGLRLSVDEQSLVRGALLHDYYLYDWHDGNQTPDRWHGFTHPRHALGNAEKDFLDLTDIERDVILHHMFPFHPAIPHTKEGWLVCLADKLCAIREMLQAMRRHA